jgi:hypothetical protein
VGHHRHADRARLRPHAYTLNGNEYVETQEYADATWIGENGQSWKFKVKVEGDTMTQIGIGNPYTEVWKRAK